MDAYNETRSKVNGKFLPQFSGKPVAIIGNVTQVHPNGSSFEMKSTDNMPINVILKEPLQNMVEGWIEVRGTGQGKCHVIAENLLWIPYDNTIAFDAALFNDAINIINTCDNPWANT